jgi:hypothetical protein
VPLVLTGAVIRNHSAEGSATPTSISTDASTPGAGSGGDGGPREGCARGQWPQPAKADPTTADARTAAPGTYLWLDFYGWHLRVRSAGADQPAVSGSFVSSEPIVVAHPWPRGAGDVVVTNANRTDFELPQGTDLTGVDVNLGCVATSVTITLERDGAPLATDQITLGEAGHPTESPMTFTRGPGGP